MAKKKALPPKNSKLQVNPFAMAQDNTRVSPFSDFLKTKKINKGSVTPEVEQDLKTLLESKAPAAVKKSMLEQFQEMYYAEQDEYGKTFMQPHGYSYDTNKGDALRLKTGKFNRAVLPKKMIDDVYAAAEKAGVDPLTLMGMVGQESTFGGTIGQAGKSAKSKKELISGWNLDEKYAPYDHLRYFADKKVPGVSSKKTFHGYEYSVDDEKAAEDYLSKNPKLLEGYGKKLKSIQRPADFDEFYEAAKWVKKRGVASYNAGDKKYNDSVMNSRSLLEKDPEFTNYVKTRKPKAEAPAENFQQGGLKKFEGGGAFSWGNNSQGQPSQAGAAIGAVGTMGAGLVNAVSPADEYGVKKTGAAIAGGALSGAAMGASFGPVGAAVGGVVGAIGGFLGNKKAREAKEKAIYEQKKAKTANRLNQSESILANYNNMGTGISSFKHGGVLTNDDLIAGKWNRTRGSVLASTPGLMGNFYQEGGLHEDAPTVMAEGGNLKPISGEAYEVQGDQPHLTDDVGIENAAVDHGEVLKPAQEGLKIFSATLKVPGTNKTFADMAKKYEKQKSINKHNPAQDALVEHKSNKLFMLQQMLNGNNQGESSDQGVVPPGEAPGRGFPRGNMFGGGGLSPISKSYHDITAQQIGSFAPNGAGAAVMNYQEGGLKKFLQGFGNFFNFRKNREAKLAAKDKTVSAQGQYSKDLATNDKIEKSIGRGENNLMAPATTAATDKKDVNRLMVPNMYSSTIRQGSISPESYAVKEKVDQRIAAREANPKQISTTALTAPLMEKAATARQNIKMPSVTPTSPPPPGKKFDWNNAMGLAGAFAPALTNLARLKNTPQVGKVDFTPAIRLEKTDNSAQIADIKEMQRAQILGGQRNNVMGQARTGLEGNVLAQGYGALNQAWQAKHNADAGIMAQQGQMNMRNNMYNNEVGNQYNKDVQARQSNIMNQESAIIAGLGQNLQGVAAQNNAMKLDKQKMQMQREYINKITGGGYDRNPYMFGLAEQPAATETAVGGLIRKKKLAAGGLIKRKVRKV